MNLIFPTLWIGDACQPEFQPAAAWLIEHGAVVVSDVATALAVINEEFSPAIIVLAQTWPGQFSFLQIAQLRQAAPLARCLRLTGPWLEGDGRNGPQLPIRLRIEWHQWERIVPLVEWNGAAAAGYSSWPETAGDDERLLAAIGVRDRSETPQLAPLNIVIHTRHREAYESLAGLIRCRGWQTEWLRDAVLDRSSSHGESWTAGAISLVLCDLSHGSQVELNSIADLQKSLGAVPMAALLGFPRLDVVQRLQEVGVSAVVGKPFLTDDLISAIEKRALAGAAGSAAAVS